MLENVPTKLESDERYRIPLSCRLTEPNADFLPRGGRMLTSLSLGVFLSAGSALSFSWVMSDAFSAFSFILAATDFLSALISS